jgi:hypothetical protein
MLGAFTPLTRPGSSTAAPVRPSEPGAPPGHKTTSVCPAAVQASANPSVTIKPFMSPSFYSEILDFRRFHALKRFYNAS